MQIRVIFNRPTIYEAETIDVEVPERGPATLVIDKIRTRLPDSLEDGFRYRLAKEIFEKRGDAVEGVLDLSEGKGSRSGQTRETPSTTKTRDGSTSDELYTLDRLPPCLFSAAWDPGLLPREGHADDWKHGSCKWVDGEVSPDSTSGGALPYIVQWPDGSGFTVLIEVSHEKGKFLKEKQSEAFDLWFTLGHQPLELLDTGEGFVSAFLDVETGGRAQFAVSVTREYLLGRYTGVTNQHHVSLLPLFTKSPKPPGAPRTGVDKPLWERLVDEFGVRTYKEFHRTAPHLVQLPPLFGDATQLRRMEWDEVPVNAKKRVRDATGGALLPAKPEVTTAMETESEFVFARGFDVVPAAEEAVLAALAVIDEMAVEEWSTPPTPAMTPSERQEALLREWLGEDMFAEGTWKVERKRKYEIFDPEGRLTAHAREEFEKHPALSLLPERAFVAGALTEDAVERINKREYAVPAIAREGLPPGVGQQGALIDTYLYIGEDGVVRERQNFRGAIAAVKGAHLRAGVGGEVLVRYNRQVPLKRAIVSTHDDVLQVDEQTAALLLSNHDVDFSDALFVMCDRPEEAPRGAPELRPALQVESERYRYGFTFQPNTSGRPVIVELSFDISTGYELDGGRRTGRRVVSYGFEFGLDHLGAGGADTSAPSSVDSGEKEAETPKSSTTPGKLVLRLPEIKREVHDRLDLLRPDLFTRPAYAVFVALATRVRERLTEQFLGPRSLKVEVAGEKARTMRDQLRK